jgi:hypothetical protein
MKYSLRDIYGNSGFTNSATTIEESIPEAEERQSYFDENDTTGEKTKKVETKSITIAIIGAVAILYFLHKS